MIQKGSRGNWTRGHYEQLRAARGHLGWSQSELAVRAGLPLLTVERLGLGSGYVLRRRSTKHAGRSKLLESNSSRKMAADWASAFASGKVEDSRVPEPPGEFTNGDHPGVRLKNPPRCKGANVSRRLEGGPQQGG